MASNIDNLKDGAFVRFENGRAVEGRKVFQRVYASTDDLLTDTTLPGVGDRFSVQYRDLAMISMDCSPRSQNADGTTTFRLTAQYVDQGAVHIEGGSSTTTVLTSFDRFGNRVILSHDGESYVAQVEYEEPRGYMIIEQHQVFEGNATIAEHVRANLNQLNAEEFQGDPPRCWRIARIDYQLVRDWVQGVQKKAYQCRYFVESLPARNVQLVPNEPPTLVPGWDKVIGFEREGGIIPPDAIFKVVQLYNEINFLGPAGIFGQVVL